MAALRKPARLHTDEWQQVYVAFSGHPELFVIQVLDYFGNEPQIREAFGPPNLKEFRASVCRVNENFHDKQVPLSVAEMRFKDGFGGYHKKFALVRRDRGEQLRLPFMWC